MELNQFSAINRSKRGAVNHEEQSITHPKINNNASQQQYMKRKKKEQEHSGKLTPEKEPGGLFLLVLGNLLYPKPSPLIPLCSLSVPSLSLCRNRHFPCTTASQKYILSGQTTPPSSFLLYFSAGYPPCNRKYAPLLLENSYPLRVSYFNWFIQNHYFGPILTNPGVTRGHARW